MNESVAVVGGGPAGMLAASALARRGAHVTLFESEPELVDSPRAITYVKPLLPDLDRWGVLPAMMERGLVDREGFNLHLSAIGEVLRFPFPSADDSKERWDFNIEIGQGDLCRIAEEMLKALPNVEVRRGERVVGLEQDRRRVRLTLEREEGAGYTHDADWVIGADGGKGVVRGLIGAKLEGFTWPEKLIATNVVYDFSQHGFANTNLYSHPTHGAVVARIDASGIWRVTFQEVRGSETDDLPKAIEDFYRGLVGDDSIEYDLRAYRRYAIHQRAATTMRAGRVLLVGDAAHLTNPTGGQGLASGIYDVAALEEALSALWDGHANERVLDMYSAGRLRVFRDHASPLAENFKRLLYDFGDDPQWVLDHTERFRTLHATPQGRAAFLSGSDILRTHPVEELAGVGV